jgi:ubiquinone/menaquinone biosynthesis C-methylase UbiE
VVRANCKHALIILKKYIPNFPCTILDVGGGAGAYAFPLAEQGHNVYLIDPIKLHIEQAQQQSIQLAGLHIGDARNLAYPNEFADIVLLMGPLYHLSNRNERIKALTEAWRILKAGGLIIAAAISRLSTALDCFSSNMVENTQIQEMLKKDITTGKHNSPSNIEYFTEAYFHHPEDLKQELIEAKFDKIEILAVEGPFWNLPNFEQLYNDSNKRAFLHWTVEKIEKDMILLGASAHILAVGYKN